MVDGRSPVPLVPVSALGADTDRDVDRGSWSRKRGNLEVEGPAWVGGECNNTRTGAEDASCQMVPRPMRTILQASFE